MTEPPAPRVVALSRDLMDRSRLAAALPDVVVVRDVDAIVDAIGDAAVVLVDLAHYADALGALRAAHPTARIVAYGPHVDDAALAAARAAGADDALPRSRFFRSVLNAAFPPPTGR